MTVNRDIDPTGYHLVDGRNEDVGPIKYVWQDHEGLPEFAGVPAGMLGRTHLVPLREATTDHVRKLVIVPYFNDTIRNTRHIEPGTELTSQDRWELYDDYGLKPPEPGAPSQYHADLQRAGRSESDDDLDTPTTPV
jgi:hypothetical protein